MLSINKSFIYGICFASVTWLVSLYLYTQLNNANEFSTVSPRAPKSASPAERAHQVAPLGKYANSEKLIKSLEPIYIKLNDKSSGVDEDLGDLGLVKTVEDQKTRDQGYKSYAYNTLVSSRLSYHRKLPDTRNELCKLVSYPVNLPTASIIICFYNEHYQTLLRTLHSIVDRTPSYLLEEIVLVDDFSDIENLHADIEKYVRENFKNTVKLFRTVRREGLIRARIFGARKASGDTIIFLDSHVEVNEQWIEPLLNRIKQNRTTVAMPVIDIINPDTFAYSSSPLVRGGFNWGLHFKWDNLPKGTLAKKSDFIKPIKSPTMAGGLFAIDRKYFTELGEYDPGMNVWGGENLEISFRIWMCGGELELVPCSRVGHIFRHRRPYGAPDGQDTMLYNSLRVANVWMDDYKEHFLRYQPNARSMSYGDVSSRVRLRMQLKCHDFDWYLKNIYPELTLPTDSKDKLHHKWEALERDKFQPWHSRRRNYTAQFQIRLSNTNLCLQSVKDFKTKGTGVTLRNCLRGKHQVWYETDRHELVLAQLLCLQAAKRNPYLYKCHEMGGDQEWKHKGENKSPIYNMAMGTCLGAEREEANTTIVMKLCSESELNKWDLIR